MTPDWQQFACPTDSPTDGERVLLAHGEGGRLTRRLIADRILSKVGNPVLATQSDAARLSGCSESMAFTTDSFVVTPLFFPGGDIGSLAIYGTVNDLVVSGARPRWLSLSFIIEEGLPFATLESVLNSIARASRDTAVEIVTGDTKVVPRGAVDKLFINTAGIGELRPPVPPGPHALQEGDEVIVTGSIGRHGIAILASREELGFEPIPVSDCGSLIPVADRIRANGCPVRAMRDATRGGVAAVLHEWADQAGKSIRILESSLPVDDDVRGACELLGLDPLHLPNEGTMVVAVPAGCGEALAAELRASQPGCNARYIGVVIPRAATSVAIRRSTGSDRALDEPAGSPLPRIC